MEKQFKIELSTDRVLMLKCALFDEEEEIDLDSLLKIDPANIYIEIATFPVVLNKVGFLLAEANNAVETAKMNLDIEEAKVADAFRNEGDGKGPSNEKVREHTEKHPRVVGKRSAYLRQMKQRDLINSFYWAMKSKDTKLEKLMHTIEAGDMTEAILNARMKKFNYVDLKIIRAKYT